MDLVFYNELVMVIFDVCLMCNAQAQDLVAQLLLRDMRKSKNEISIYMEKCSLFITTAFHHGRVTGRKK